MNHHRQRLVHALFILVATGTGAALMCFINAFADVLLHFGADLPGLTRFAMSHPYGVLLLPTLVASQRLLWLASGRGINWVSAGIILLVVLLCVSAMYLPVFSLGRIV